MAALEFFDPALGDPVDLHGIDEVQLFPATSSLPVKWLGKIIFPLSGRRRAIRPWAIETAPDREIAMRRILASAFISLDGVMQAPGGPEEDPTGGFALGGWTAPYFNAALGSVMGEIFGRPFDLLLGRKTYDIFAAHWPYVTDPNDPIAGMFNNVTKYVASRSRPKLAWQKSQLLGEDVVTSVREVRRGEGPDLLVQGSSDFLQTLWTNNLVDEFTVLIFPLVLGHGKRIFADGAPPFGLKLAKSKPYPTGVIVANYQRDGEVKTGDFSLPQPSEAELERRRTLG
jgi:dihydrofolate reductase